LDKLDTPTMMRTVTEDYVQQKSEPYEGVVYYISLIIFLHQSFSYFDSFDCHDLYQGYFFCDSAVNGVCCLLPEEGESSQCCLARSRIYHGWICHWHSPCSSGQAHSNCSSVHWSDYMPLLAPGVGFGPLLDRYSSIF